jgi:hypothetical protein
VADEGMVDRYFEALARRAAEGRIPATREPLPLRTLAELLADTADEVVTDMAVELRGANLIIAVLVDRLGGDVEIAHADLAAVMPKALTRFDDQGDTMRLSTR